MELNQQIITACVPIMYQIANNFGLIQFKYFFSTPEQQSHKISGCRCLKEWHDTCREAPGLHRSMCRA
jgi:hypothetical protein